MKAQIRQVDPEREFFTPERCYILELSNTPEDAALSIARARVLPGVSTRWHRVIDTAERYVILEGHGQVEVKDLGSQAVKPGDVVIIPAGYPQRITNPGESDLVFLALCTPRFEQANYLDIEDSGV
ncbi:MAG TPA: cupin domain-containing protein [Methylophilaceae bacterium]|nr:cupin domain-containing protein [Methylophilaceae bacterium]